MHGWSRGIVLTLVVLNGIAAVAQDSTLYIYGKVKSYHTGRPLTEIIVQAIDRRDTTDRIRARTNAQGRYELILHAGQEYAVIYQAVGHLTKHLLVDAQGPVAPQWKDGFGMQIDMVLLEPMEGVDMSLLREPMGKCGFDPATGQFTWDRTYAEVMRPRLKELTDAVDQRSPPLYPGPLLDIPVVKGDTTKH